LLSIHTVMAPSSRVGSQERVAAPTNSTRRSISTTRRTSVASKQPRRRRAFTSFEQNAIALLTQYQDTLRKLAHSEALNSGNLPRAFQAISAACCRLLRVKRSSTWLVSKARGSVALIDLCESGRQHSSPDVTFKSSYCPVYLRSLTREHRAIATHHASQDRRFRELAQGYLSRFNITSMLSAPIRQKGKLVGILCAESVGTPRQWSRQEKDLASLLATMATFALEAAERRDVQQALPKKPPRLPTEPRVNSSPA
jgi:two-component system, sensor histidine kinase and response regulator